MKGFNSLTAKYTFISLLLLLFFGIYLYAGFLFSWHMSDVARKMNLAGRERMLTLRMSYHIPLIIEMKPSHDKNILIQKAEKSMAEYEEAIYGIRDGSKKLGLEPIPERDKESLSRINELIRFWEETQKPAVSNLMNLPAERKNESCGICHSAVPVELAMVEGLVRSLENYYDKGMREFDTFRMYTFGFFLVMALFIFLYVRKSLVMPVIRLRDAVSEFEKGNFSTRTDIKSRDEIGELSEGFNQMAQALNATFEEKKRLMEGLEEKVTERTARLEEARMMAEAANRSKSDFLANMSHELRTPLNAVMGFSEVMRDGLAGPVTEEQKEYLTDILESGEHLLSLINDILDLTKIEAGKIELEFREFDLKELIERALIMFKEKSVKHKMELGNEVDPEIGAVVADERRVKQVLFNLLSNAFKFTPDNGRITVRARKIPGEPGQIECSVEDTGPGIKEEDISRLFKPFEQLEAMLTKEHGGTGLGLALCKKIVELHDGRIWVESEFGRGSRFIFRLPARKR